MQLTDVIICTRFGSKMLPQIRDFKRIPKRHFGSDQLVWRDGDWNGFVRIALAELLDVRNCRGEI